ncbi:MAG: hypothetical protein NWF01_06805 [Candidatus Bathyarchaeota archaeon]|nr:hypothetical protein [Candidatus Bathyarchaeota archaeon]
MSLSQDQEKMRSLLNFKKKLEDQLEKLTAEAKEVQESLEVVNTILLDKGFKRGDIKNVSTPPADMPKEVLLPKPTEPPTPAEEPKEDKPAPEDKSVISLRTMADEPLAIIYFDKQLAMHVLPDESKNFKVKIPPFENFLVEKVFNKMQQKDQELVAAGQLSSDHAFSYNMVLEDDLIREIIIQNVDDERLKELKSSIRWTLEKMFEKIKS